MLQTSKLLTENDYKEASLKLQCEIATIKAVAEVESAGYGFFTDDSPKILFEAHIFSKLTNHLYDKDYPDISSKKWNKSLYLSGLKEYSRLLKAQKLSSVNAVYATSWGKFQIMGFNFGKCGYSDIYEFISDMYESEGKHLQAFCNFILSERLEIALRNKDWKLFAKRYNGANYAQNKYDIKLEKAYNKYKGEIK